MVEGSTAPEELQALWRTELEKTFPDELIAHPLRVGELASALYQEWLQAHPDDHVVAPADLNLAAIMHDIGKRDIPPEILTKSNGLSDTEMAIIRTHTVAGSEWLLKSSSHPVAALAAGLALRHHEHWDGGGYPGNCIHPGREGIPSCEGLKGADIPFLVRVTSICDVYDALRRKRSYKDAWSHEDAIAFIEAGSGSQFDPELTKLFVSIVGSIP